MNVLQEQTETDRYKEVEMERSEVEKREKQTFSDSFYIKIRENIQDFTVNSRQTFLLSWQPSPLV